jgi:hypothetical protein
MKRLLLSLACAALAAAPLHAAPTDDEVAARRKALDVAGAFGNDGFKLRDGSWTGTLEIGKPKVLQVNLYAGNQYWFTLGSVPAAKKVKVTIYDEAGGPVEFDPYDEEASVAAAGFSPATSGSFYIKVEEIEGTAAAFCLVYSYK